MNVCRLRYELSSTGHIGAESEKNFQLVVDSICFCGLLQGAESSAKSSGAIAGEATSLRMHVRAAQLVMLGEQFAQACCCSCVNTACQRRT